jgi:hypothetical protein
MTRPTDWESVFGFADPTPGDPWVITTASRAWRDIATESHEAETTLRRLLGDQAVAAWVGRSGDSFRSHSTELPDQLHKAYVSYDAASSALSWWSTRLSQHQHDADRALADGRAAQTDLAAAHSRLSSAQAHVTATGNDGSLTYTGDAAHAPTPEAVQAALGRYHAAQEAARNASAAVGDAQSRLDAARRLAEQAGQLRRQDGRTTAHRINEAADAGIKPRSWWQKAKEAIAKAWHVIVEIAKVVVLVLGVIALIVGGPLAWIVFAAALIVLADTLIKKMQGKATWGDVFLAALACIPGTKGLTSITAIREAFAAGGMLGAAAHVAGAGRTAVTSLAQGMATLSREAWQLRGALLPGIKAAVQVLGHEGALAVPQLRTTLREMSSAFDLRVQAQRLVVEARNWQHIQTFPGVDDYAGTVLQAGHRLEAGAPGLSRYAMDGGNAAAHGGSASGVWESVQVGPNMNPHFDPYRGSLVELRVDHPVPAATGPTLANPQYGAGGATQYFFDIKHSIVAGDVSVLDHAGQPIHIPAGTTPASLEHHLASVLNPSGGGPLTGTITLSGTTHVNPGIVTQQATAAAHPHLPASNPDITWHGPGAVDVGQLRNVLRSTGIIGSAVAR